MPSSTSSDHDHGQATVELALALPVLVLVGLLVVQVAVIARDRLAVEAAARDGARAAAVAGRAEVTERAAQRAVALSPLQVAATGRDGEVTVTVRYVDHTDVPLVGALLPDVAVTARSTMPFEPP